MLSINILNSLIIPAIYMRIGALIWIAKDPSQPTSTIIVSPQNKEIIRFDTESRFYQSKEALKGKLSLVTGRMMIIRLWQGAYETYTVLSGDNYQSISRTGDGTWAQHLSWNTKIDKTCS